MTAQAAGLATSKILNDKNIDHIVLEKEKKLLIVGEFL